MEDFNSVNAEQGNVVDSSVQESSNEVSENQSTVQSEQISTVAESKPVQDKETNAQYAKIRRESEQKAKDAVIAEMYGQTHGIYTYDQYRQAIQQQQVQQQAEQYGVDPNFYNEFNSLKNELTSIKSESEALKREKLMIEQNKNLENDPNLGHLYKQWKADVEAFADQANCDLDTAFTVIARNKLPEVLGQANKAAQAAEQNQKNMSASTGSVTGQGQTNHVHYTREQVASMSPSEVSKNWTAVNESMKHWK